MLSCATIKMQKQEADDMIAILDINGWRKEIQVSETILRSGVIEIDILPPFDTAVRSDDFISVDCAIKIVRLIRTLDENGKPLFII